MLSEDLLMRCGERAASYDRDNRFFTEDFQELRDAGYLLLSVPKEFGGLGLPLAEVCQEQRRLAYHEAPTAIAVNMHLYWTGVATDLWRSGDKSLQWLLESAASGAVFAAGHAEQANDLPLLYSTTLAERVDGGYRFTGKKSFGSLSPVWTHLGLMSLFDPERCIRRRRLLGVTRGCLGNATAPPGVAPGWSTPPPSRSAERGHVMKNRLREILGMSNALALAVVPLAIAGCNTVGVAVNAAEYDAPHTQSSGDAEAYPASTKNGVDVTSVPITTVASFDDFAGQLPESIAVDRFGNIYVSMSTLGEIWKLDPAGSFKEIDVGRREAGGDRRADRRTGQAQPLIPRWG